MFGIELIAAQMLASNQQGAQLVIAANRIAKALEDLTTFLKSEGVDLAAVATATATLQSATNQLDAANHSST